MHFMLGLVFLLRCLLSIIALYISRVEVECHVVYAMIIVFFLEVEQLIGPLCSKVVIHCHPCKSFTILQLKRF